MQATKLLTHSVSPIIIAGGLTLTYNFALKTERVVHCPVPPRHAPPCPMRRDNDHGSLVMGHVGHGSIVWWVAWVMGHEKWPISISASKSEEQKDFFVKFMHRSVSDLLSCPGREHKPLVAYAHRLQFICLPPSSVTGTKGQKIFQPK